MNANTQRWRTCAYSCAAGDGEYSHMLHDHGLNESYNCENPEVVKSGRHHTKPIRERDDSFTTVAELQHIWFGVFPYGYGGAEPTKEEKEKLETAVENELAVCKDCKLHLPKTEVPSIAHTALELYL